MAASDHRTQLHLHTRPTIWPFVFARGFSLNLRLQSIPGKLRIASIHNISIIAKLCATWVPVVESPLRRGGIGGVCEVAEDICKTFLATHHTAVKY